MGAESAVEEISPGETGEASEAKASSAPPPATPPDENASKRATRAVELAGRALDPTNPGGPDQELARLLLREAVTWSARAVLPEQPAPSTLAESIERLERHGVLARVDAKKGALAAQLALLDLQPPTEIPELELKVAQVVEAAAGKRRLALHRRVRRIGLVALIVATAIAVPVFAYLRFPSDSYTFRASSAHRGFRTEGEIGRIYSFGLILHTEQENGPWVEIDLEKTRKISTVTLKNRADCCHDRGLPMVVEVAGEDKAWQVVGERDQSFDRWIVKFPEREARWVRVRSTANTVLHFREIKVK